MKKYATITDVIKRLQELKDEHGDVVVCCAEIFGGGYGEIKLFDLEDVVQFVPESPSPFAGRKENIPNCVSISL